MRPLIFILFFINLACSCDNRRHMPKPISNIETIGQREDRQVKEVVDNIVQKIDLSDLKKGVDSLEMRLWYPDHDMVENILTIRFVDTLLIATKTNIWQTLHLALFEYAKIKLVLIFLNNYWRILQAHRTIT